MMTRRLPLNNHHYTMNRSLGPTKIDAIATLRLPGAINLAGQIRKPIFRRRPIRSASPASPLVPLVKGAVITRSLLSMSAYYVLLSIYQDGIS